VHASREWNGINGTGSWVDLVWPRLVAVHWINGTIVSELVSWSRKKSTVVDASSDGREISSRKKTHPARGKKKKKRRHGRGLECEGLLARERGTATRVISPTACARADRPRPGRLARVVFLARHTRRGGEPPQVNYLYEPEPEPESDPFFLSGLLYIHAEAACCRALRML
jgi:hypothetical protein